MKKRFIKGFFVFALMIGLIMGLLPQNVYADVEINSTNFPDPNFLNSIKSQFDTDGDNNITTAELLLITTINVNGLGISNLQGIEYFTSLWNLYCVDNNLTSIDISSLTKLGYLNCSNNDISTLDLSTNISLQQLVCQNNNISAFDFSNNINLRQLDCSNNNITSLDFSNNPNLNTLYCQNNYISSLNLGFRSTMIFLYCYDNPLISLTLPSNTGGTATVSPDPAGGGTVYISHESTTNLANLPNILFVANANNGYAFDSWTENGGNVVTGGATSDPFPLPTTQTFHVIGHFVPVPNPPKSNPSPSLSPSQGSSGYTDGQIITETLPITGESDSALLGLMVMCVGACLLFFSPYFLFGKRKYGEKKTSY